MDAPATRKRHNEELRLLTKARLDKEEFIKQKNLEKATEEYIDAMYFISIYHSDACIKDDPRNVAKMLKMIKSEAGKLDALKTNISIRVKGFGWEWCHHAWSKDGWKYSVKELSDHLRWMIKQEQRKIEQGKLEIPKEPSPNIPKRRKVGQLGTQIDLLDELDSKYLANEIGFKTKAESILKNQEDSGVSSIYARMQPF